MPMLGIPNLHSVATSLLNPLHKRLPNGSLLCALNSSVVLERKGLVNFTFLHNVETTIEDTLFWFNVVFTAYGNPSIDLNLSHINSLRCFQGTYSEMSMEVWKLCRLVLIAWGYIIYPLLNAAEDWRDHISCTLQFIQNITSSGLLDLPRRGLIIQAQNPPPFEDIVIYLHHQVSVHYYWTTGCIHWLDPAALLSVDIHAAPLPCPAELFIGTSSLCFILLS
ncbi:hypothetical protein EDD22DRAFT_950523 [Suillus occidentalis]|nr:hypothetical protein EDD22DRAFT_950523 [Suillus occidentalis]